MTYEETLEKYGSLTRGNRGTSMLPLLKEGRDLFTVEPRGEGRLSKYDVVLYRRPPDQYVLHRIVKVRPDGYEILGDNCVRREKDIRDEDILGVMTSFVRKGKTHRVTEFPYRVYSVLRVLFSPVRIFLAKVKRRLRNMKI